MFDDSQRLRDNPLLFKLLSHYAQSGSEDRTTWRDRLMHLDDVDTRGLSMLHGELIAFDWIEQNTGQAVARDDGTLSQCYRITPNGLREVRRLQGAAGEEPLESLEKSKPKLGRKKGQKSERVEALTAGASAASPGVDAAA